MQSIPSTHTDFVITRDFAAAPASVFQAWADPDLKRAWSDCHTEHGTTYHLDFRLYGRETHRVTYPDGRLQSIEKVFLDIVEAQRIVFGYDIRIDGKPLSVSLVTVEFFAHGGGTRMVYTEQLAYLDGHEDRAQRLQGTQEGFDRLAQSLH